MKKILFEVEYHTKWGQQLVLQSDVLLQYGGSGDRMLMTYREEGIWSYELFLLEEVKSLAYRYLVVNDADEVIDREWGSGHNLILESDNTYCRDAWISRQHPENAFYNSAFEKVLFNVEHKGESEALRGSYLKFCMDAPRVSAGEVLCVVGNIPALGGWELANPLLMSSKKYPQWEAMIPWPVQAYLEYKYGIYNITEEKVKVIESGPNRIFSTYPLSGIDLICLNDRYFRHPMGFWKGAGIAIPIFSIRTRSSLGVGDFSDLKILIDWAGKVGLKMVQILPINDTTANMDWRDSYPYSSISVAALHPLYLDVTKLDGFDEIIDFEDYSKLQSELNAHQDVSYQKVISSKLRFAKAIFQRGKMSFFKTKDYKEFYQRSKSWLDPYAVFCTLRDRYGTPDFNEWGDDSVFSSTLVKEYISTSSPLRSSYLFYCFLQYYLDRQLYDAALHARESGVVLKGDIAIGIYRNSADAWSLPHLFDHKVQAGAPPDPFSDLGQNWGFPTYKWDLMKQEKYKWWRERLTVLSRYFDAYRIDHILGFFRIWQIPDHYIQGIAGHFDPAIALDEFFFKERGIPFDADRYCNSFITHPIISDLFGADSEVILDRFLEMKSSDRLAFKSNLNTQRKIENYLQQNPELDKYRDRLFSLVANVLFVRDSSSEKPCWHPRIDLHKTSSFAALHPSIQTLLREVHDFYFYELQNEFWKRQGLEKLPAIKAATDMLICGEDLGMIPACVPEVMQELDLLTLEIHRMSKNPHTRFVAAQDVPYLSVGSTSTHDMSPLRAWWTELSTDDRSYLYYGVLGLTGEIPGECTAHMVSKIIDLHLHWPSMWTVFPLQDLLAMSDQLKNEDPLVERINIPADPNHQWKYRMHLYVEDLLEAEEFNLAICDRLQKSGRL